MTLSRKLLFSLSVAILSLLSSCSLKQMVKLAEQQELNVTPSPLELHGDSVKFDVSATIPVKMLKKNKIYTIKTWYEYGDPTTELDKFEFTDTEFPNQKVEQPSITKSFSFPYTDEAMKTGELKIQGVASNLEKTKYKETAILPIAKGLITTSRLYLPSYEVVFADHGYNNKEELIPNNVDFFFEQGSAKLRKSEVSGEQGKLLNAFIASKNVTRTVTITGTHSPEGLENINSKLAEDRAKVIKDFYFRKMKEYDYKGLADSIKFETKAVFQNWDALKKELNAYASITSEEKSQITSIIDGSNGSFEDKAKAISKLSFYKKVLDDVYPQLRASQTEILSVKQKKTDAEINVLARAIYKGEASADTLTYEELMYAASLTPLLEEKIKIYETATKSNDSWKSHNNLGVAYYKMSEKTSNTTSKNDFIAKAKAQFELAVNKEDNAFTQNNLAGVYLSEGDHLKAETLFNKAQDAAGGNALVSKSIAAGKGVINIRKGNYTEAIASLSNAEDIENASYNLGLTYLLNKDYDKATTALEKESYENKNNALLPYLRAILAARQGDETALGVTLGQAVQIGNKLKEKALNDLEFESFKTKPSFIEALK